MSYDDALAQRLRRLLSDTEEVTERKMFGGLAFLVRGHMAVVASGEGGLLVRIDPESSAELTSRTPAVPAVMRGRELPGWVRIDSLGVATRQELSDWVARSVRYVETLPPKT